RLIVALGNFINLSRNRFVRLTHLLNSLSRSFGALLDLVSIDVLIMLVRSSLLISVVGLVNFSRLINSIRCISRLISASLDRFIGPVHLFISVFQDFFVRNK